MIYGGAYFQKLILDRSPVQYSEGSFWGNGCIVSLPHIRDDRVCFSLDDIALWETRDRYDEFPSGTFFQNDPDAFLQGGSYNILIQSLKF